MITPHHFASRVWLWLRWCSLGFFTSGMANRWHRCQTWHWVCDVESRGWFQVLPTLRSGSQLKLVRHCWLHCTPVYSNDATSNVNCYIITSKFLYR
jgi:hypothetical protein